MVQYLDVYIIFLCCFKLILNYSFMSSYLEIEELCKFCIQYASFNSLINHKTTDCSAQQKQKTLALIYFVVVVIFQMAEAVVAAQVRC